LPRVSSYIYSILLLILTIFHDALFLHVPVLLMIMILLTISK